MCVFVCARGRTTRFNELIKVDERRIDARNDIRIKFFRHSLDYCLRLHSNTFMNAFNFDYASSSSTCRTIVTHSVIVSHVNLNITNYHLFETKTKRRFRRFSGRIVWQWAVEMMKFLSLCFLKMRSKRQARLTAKKRKTKTFFYRRLFCLIFRQDSNLQTAIMYVSLCISVVVLVYV